MWANLSFCACIRVEPMSIITSSKAAVSSACRCRCSAIFSLNLRGLDEAELGPFGAAAIFALPQLHRTAGAAGAAGRCSRGGSGCVLVRMRRKRKRTTNPRTSTSQHDGAHWMPEVVVQSECVAGRRSDALDNNELQ